MKLKIINKLKKTCNYLFKPLTVIFFKNCALMLVTVLQENLCVRTHKQNKVFEFER